jgi:hypothetical protein
MRKISLKLFDIQSFRWLNQYETGLMYFSMAHDKWRFISHSVNLPIGRKAHLKLGHSSLSVIYSAAGDYQE